jgi:hypothetical protein
MSRVTKMSAPLPQTNSDQMALPWMSFAEDSPAKTSHTQGGGQAWKAQDQGYGARSPAWLASYDRNTSSWKTSQHSLVEGLDEFSETWPRSGTTRNGIAYQLPPLALLTGETASGLWPTPRARDGQPEGFQSGLNRQGLSLPTAAKLWPTPRVQSSRGSGPSRVGNRMDLQTAIQYWPTTQDAKNNGAPSQMERNSLPLNAAVGGALNPTWVEWLMGFPSGWTVSKAWETRSSRKSQKSLAGQS